MENDKSTNSKNWLKIFYLIIFAGVIFAVFQFTPLSLSDFTPSNIKNFILGFGVIAPIIFIAIYTLRAVILVLPVGVMSLAGGLAFGQWFGTLYILIGATAGSCLSFLIARYLGRDFIDKLGVFKKGKLKNFDESVEKNSLRVILFMRLIPLFQYDAVNFGSGLSKMKFRDYALGSFIGMAPGGFINALLGSSLENVISVQFFAALGFFILLMFIPTIYKKVKSKKSTKDKTEDKRTAKAKRGECPGCGAKIGPVALLKSWDTWGHFVCPKCNTTIRFAHWLGAVAVLTGSFVLIERIVRFLISHFVTDYPSSPGPLWLIFLLAFVLSIAVLFIVPMVWRIEKN